MNIKEKIKIICLILITGTIIAMSLSLHKYFITKNRIEAFTNRANCLMKVRDISAFGKGKEILENLCADIVFQLEK